MCSKKSRAFKLPIEGGMDDMDGMDGMDGWMV